MTLTEWLDFSRKECNRTFEEVGLFDYVQREVPWVDRYIASKLEGKLPLTVTKEWVKEQMRYADDEVVAKWVYLLQRYQTDEAILPAGIQAD